MVAGHIPHHLFIPKWLVGNNSVYEYLKIGKKTGPKLGRGEKAKSYRESKGLCWNKEAPEQRDVLGGEAAPARRWDE